MIRQMELCECCFLFGGVRCRHSRPLAWLQSSTQHSFMCTSCWTAHWNEKNLRLFASLAQVYVQRISGRHEAQSTRPLCRMPSKQKKVPSQQHHHHVPRGVVYNCILWSIVGGTQQMVHLILVLASFILFVQQSQTTGMWEMRHSTSDWLLAVHCLWDFAGVVFTSSVRQKEMWFSFDEGTSSARQNNSKMNATDAEQVFDFDLIPGMRIGNFWIFCI